MTPADLAGLGDTIQRTRASIQGTLGYIKQSLQAENERLQKRIAEQDKRIQSLQTESRELNQQFIKETRKQNRTQLRSGVVLMIIGAVVGWLLASVDNPSQVFSLVFPMTR